MGELIHVDIVDRTDGVARALITGGPTAWCGYAAKTGRGPIVVYASHIRADHRLGRTSSWERAGRLYAEFHGLTDATVTVDDETKF